MEPADSSPHSKAEVIEILKNKLPLLCRADSGSKVRGAISVKFVSQILITASLLLERWSILYNIAVTKQ